MKDFKQFSSEVSASCCFSKGSALQWEFYTYIIDALDAASYISAWSCFEVPRGHSYGHVDLCRQCLGVDVVSCRGRKLSKLVKVAGNVLNVHDI